MIHLDFVAPAKAGVEFHECIEDAIRREKAIKKWLREWKIELIEKMNPDWNYHYELVNAQDAEIKRGPRIRGGDGQFLSSGAKMNLDISIEAPWPAATDWEALAARVAAAVGEVAPELGNARLSACMLFASDEDIRGLNREWRSKDTPTNVLSFPMLSREELLALSPQGPPVMLGDVALALETCDGEALERGVPIADHAAHLIAHGLLHLAGYDHEQGPAQAERMEALETKALAILGLQDPYGVLD